jgi:hypothetical protein
MKLYKNILLLSVLFQPFCFGMELPDTSEKNYKKINPSLEGKMCEEIVDRDFYSDNIRVDKATTEYQEAIKLWDIDIQYALRHMLEAEKLEHKEAKEKLAEMRKSKTYSEPKMTSKNDPGMLLKFFEIPPRAQYNAIMHWQGINKEYALDYFIELAESEDTPKNIKKQVIEQLTKIRKTNGYRKPSTVQCADQSNNIGYLLYEKENNHTKHSFSKKNGKNATSFVQNSKNTNGKKINNNLYFANNHQGDFKSSQIAFSQSKNVNEQEMSDDIYSKTQGIFQDSEETLRYFNFAINQITVETQFSLGMMYFQGQGVEKDLGKALTYFKLAADQGHAYAQFNLGAMYFEALGVSQDLEQTVKYFKLAANQKYAQAQFSLGMMYFQGLGVTQSLEKAVRYFKLAADQGNVAAQYTLSGMYDKGQGVKKSLKKTLKYCKLAADQGHIEAQFNLGVMYSDDQGVENNLGEALKYYKLAADQGHAEGQFNLGAMYYNAEGAQRDLEEAVRYFTLAADQGNAEGQFNLGVMYYSAEGVAQDLEKAFSWFKRAADQGLADAQFNLGVMYSEAQGVEQNLTETLRYYKLAADQGHAEGQFNVGAMYYSAEGVEEDLDEAVRYFKLAAVQGHEEAQCNLDSIDANVDGIAKNNTMDFQYSQNSTAQEVGKSFHQISILNQEAIHEAHLNDSHDLLQTTVRQQNRLEKNKNSIPTQQTVKNQSSDLFLGEINTSGNVVGVKKTLMAEENRRKIRKTQSLNNLKSCHSSFENFEALPLNTTKLKPIKVSAHKGKNKEATYKFQSVINLTSSFKENESVFKRTKEQKKNKSPITKIKLKNHSNHNKKVLNCNSLNDFDQSILMESSDYSSSEKSLSDTPFEVLFKPDGKRDEDLKQLKKLLNNRDLRKASEINLNRSIVVRALRELGPNGKKIITWSFETNGNKNKSKIRAEIVRKTNNINNSKIPSLNIHLHSPRGKWYDDVNIKNHFLDFIRFCDTGVNALIEVIERK